MGTYSQKPVILNKWQDYYFKVERLGLITDEGISSAHDAFNSEIVEQLIKSNANDIPYLKLLIIFKVKTVSFQYRTVSYMQTIEVKDFYKIKQLFIEFWNLKSEDYILAPYSDIIFTYNILHNHSNIKPKLLKPAEVIKTKTETVKIGGYILPGTMDFTEWGEFQWIDESNVIVYKKHSNLEYHIKVFDDHQTVELKLDEKIVLTFTDIRGDKYDLNTFSRIQKNKKYFFERGKLLVHMNVKNIKFLGKVKAQLHNSKNFLTMDLETRIINQVMSSYCVSIYDGNTKISFYLRDFPSEKEMLRASIKYLMKRKYNNYRVFIHNFSNFDAVFLLTVLTDMGTKVQPLLRDGRYIDLRFNFANKYKLYFRDSLLLLPASLRHLAKEFDVENKGLFPYKFVNNSDISLDYKGAVPSIDYFEGLTLDEYNAYVRGYKDREWDLREETIKYCELDCVVLHQIISKFSDIIYKNFRIDLLRYPTLSSLAFAIYRTEFLNESQIPLIHGEIYEFIKKAYTGGSVDVYKPISNQESKVYRYDVNSLYPFVMKKFPMPTGNPIFFEGNILNHSIQNQIKKIHSLPYSNELQEDISLYFNNRPYGIFEVDITAPDNLKIPLLQTRIKTDKGYRTVAPTGNWTGHYFSDELYNAEKFGYSFKVLKGYLFKKSDIFRDYVEFLYEMKKNSSKGSPLYIISKLLLNSLYGRLGMNPLCESHVIETHEKAVKLYSNFNITNIIDLKNGKELISYFKPHSDSDLNFNIKNISVVVSAIVTASARIHMTQFKVDKSLTIFYTDTDSIDIDRELNSKFVGNDLGQMKLEHIFDEAVFLAPKMYAGKNKYYEYCRIKGVKNPVCYDSLKALLQKDSKLEVRQEKWYSDISNGRFNIKDEIYTLMVTDKKRKLIYNDNNQFIDTDPIRLKDGVVVNGN